MLSLRYDLSVSFARWLAMNTNCQQIKRISVGNVFRRDQPVSASPAYEHLKLTTLRRSRRGVFGNFDKYESIPIIASACADYHKARH
jgi:hypothetical protein